MAQVIDGLVAPDKRSVRSRQAGFDVLPGLKAGVSYGAQERHRAAPE
jgi:hypothetical protein